MTRRPTTTAIDPTRTHDDGPLAGEPRAARPPPALGPARLDAPHAFPLLVRARARAMGRKAAEVPPDGTSSPTTTNEGRGSLLPVVAASRAIPADDLVWVELVQNGTILAPPYDPWVLVCSVEESDALPFLIDAMATNLTGFGWDLLPTFRLHDPETGERLDPPPEAEEERALVELFLAAVNVELGFTGVLDLADRDTEITGSGYLELLRDGEGKPAALEHLPSYTMRLGRLSTPVLCEIPFRHPTTGELVTLRRWRRFRTFVQCRDQRTAYFRQFGDPRPINWQTGEYGAPGTTWGTDEQGNALDGTEVIFRRIYAPHTPYGVPRWVGGSPHARAGRGAAELLVSWFDDAPIGAKLALIAGGSWNSDSLDAAIGRIDAMARGAENAWSIVALEAESAAQVDRMGDTADRPPSVSIDDLTFTVPPELYQRDGLIDQSVRRLAALFKLPPIYWGASDDFSRAAANTARATTEEQVFVPLRALRWELWFNSELLPSLGVNHWSIKLRGANTSDDGDLSAGLSSVIGGGGASPNALIRILNELTGQDSDLIAEPWGDRPLALTLALLQLGRDPNAPLDEAPEAEGEAPVEGEGRTGPNGADLQATALNGAQVTAALEIVTAFQAGTLPRESAVAMLVEFFQLPASAADRVVGQRDPDATEALAPPPPPASFGGGAFGKPAAEGDPDPTATVAKASVVVRELVRLRAQLQAAIDPDNEPHRG